MTIIITITKKINDNRNNTYYYNDSNIKNNGDIDDNAKQKKIMTDKKLAQKYICRKKFELKANEESRTK